MKVYMKTLVALMLSAGLVSNASASTVSVGSTVAAGAFSKTFSFNVASGYVAGLFGSMTSTVDNILGETYGLDITGVSLNSTALTLSTVSSTDFVIDPDWSATTTSTTFALSGLTAGAYTLTISGVAYSDAEFGGAFSVSALPVPEPTELGMLLAGLGLVGFASRRKAA